MPIQTVGLSEEIRASCWTDGSAAPDPPRPPHPHDLRRARPHVTHRMDAERGRDVRPVISPAGDPGGREGAGETDHVVQDVLEGLGVEQRLSRAAAGTPVLADRLGADGAELLVEPLGGHRPELVLGEDRNLRPFLRVVELARVDPREARAPERRAPGALDGEALAPALDGLDFLRALRDAEGKLAIDAGIPPGQRFEGAHPAPFPPR